MKSPLNIPESLIHQAWQQLAFDIRSLQTTQGKSVQIRKQGLLNSNQGPDFLEAHLQIDGVDWYGQVEMHIHSRDWYRHRHHEDPAYNATILHVVLHSDGQEVQRQDGSLIPELELAPYLPDTFFKETNQNPPPETSIPCGGQMNQAPSDLAHKWLEQLGRERLHMKADRFGERLHALNQDWDQLVWEEIAAFMGGPVNQEAFREIARRLPYKLLARSRSLPVRIEALLMGMAGLLQADHEGDPYVQQLRFTWEYLGANHGLSKESPISVRFMRMRPAAFPSIRLAQMSQLLQRWSPMLNLLQADNFAFFLEEELSVGGYWHSHYQFGKTSTPGRKALGKDQKMILAINVLLPLSLLQEQQKGKVQSLHKLTDILKNWAPEKNRITRQYAILGLSPDSALQSQGMLQLRKHYCDATACLKCDIGKYLLSHQRQEPAA